ncbi:MAG: NFACT family protein, partial [Enterococcus sp.]|nr:NFACT family protein [Enterococcus sp.]
FNSNGNKRQLYINVGAGSPFFCLTNAKFEDQGEPTALCMLFRKNLNNAKVSSIKQINDDRILEIAFNSFDEMGYNQNKSLIIEIMGRHSNVILVNSSTGKIIDSLKRISVDKSKMRQIMPSLAYEYPPTKPNFDVAHDDVDCDIGNSDANLQLSQRIWDFYQTQQSTSRIKARSKSLDNVVKNLIDKTDIKLKKLEKELHAAKNSEKYQLWGEILQANLYQLSAGQTEATLLNYYDNTMITIPMDASLSPAKNASKYFKKYSKLKTAVREKTLQIEETKARKEYLDSILVMLQNSTSIDAIDMIRDELYENNLIKKTRNNRNAKKPKIRPLEYEVNENFTIYVGRNNKENDHLTFKIASRNDLWLHTKDIPGSHVVIKSSSQNIHPTDEIIGIAASLAAFYSKARSS